MSKYDTEHTPEDHFIKIGDKTIASDLIINFGNPEASNCGGSWDCGVRAN